MPKKVKVEFLKDHLYVKKGSILELPEARAKALIAEEICEAKPANTNTKLDAIVLEPEKKKVPDKKQGKKK